LSLPTILIQYGSKEQGNRQGHRVGRLASQLQRLLAPLQGLVGIAQTPQDLGEAASAKHPDMGRTEEAMSAVLLGSVEAYVLLYVCAGHIEITEEPRGIPQQQMGMRDPCRVVDMLGQAQGLLSQLPRHLILPPIIVQGPQSVQYAQELRCLPHLLAQHARPLIDGLHFWGSKPFDGCQRLAEGRLHLQLLPAALDGLRHDLEHLEPLGEVADRFDIG